jgi:hydrogenase nickel incorporation protein HypA/HybF
MHEGTLVRDLVRKVTSLAQVEGGARVTQVTVKLGRLSHISPSHLREHFEHETLGTIAEGAWLDVEVMPNTDDPMALELILDSIQVVSPELVGPQD